MVLTVFYVIRHPAIFFFFNMVSFLWNLPGTYLSPLSICSRTLRGRGRDGTPEMNVPLARSLSLFGPLAAAAFLLESSFALPSFSRPTGCSELLFEEQSEGDWGWLDVGVRGPFSAAAVAGGAGGEGRRPFLAAWLVLGLGWWAAAFLVGVEALPAPLALAASAALAFFCLLSSAARLLLKVSVLGERLEGRLREREWRWRLRERECLEEGYGLRLRDLTDRLGRKIEHV